MAKQTFTTGQVLTAAQMTSLQQTAMGGGSTTAKTTSYVLVAADAGTVVAMNAAGSTTVTVNTGLFSAGDTVFIQNWGAGVCTVTAGTATVTTHGSLALSQWEGGTLYFTSASAAIFFDISQSTGMTNPMTTTGDTIYSSSGSTPARLGIGSTGQVLTVAGGVPTWATPASGSTFVGVKLSKSAAQSLSNNTGTKITWDTEDYDTDAFHSTSSNTSRITVPSGKAGKYRITATGSFANSATGQRYLAFYKNGTMILVFSRLGGFSSFDTAACGTIDVNLSVGDYIELEAFQNSGGALDFGGTILSDFSAQYLGA